MSSGEKAKPPATFEERNPFDISRRSGPEVAAEIAKRMSAWKQARARTATTPTTLPEAKSRIGDVKSPPIAAPVQPARMPKSAPAAPQPAPSATAHSSGSSTLRVPYFASASATRRAMPPAPSLKQGGTRQANPEHDELAAGAEEPAIATAAPVLEQPPHDTLPPDATDHAPATTTVEAPVADPTAAGSLDEAAIEADAAPAVVPPDPAELPLTVQASDPAPAEPDDNERRRAEARALKARWIAAHDLDALLDTSGADKAATVETAAAAHETGGGDGVETSAREQPAETLDSPLPDEGPAAAGDELLLDEPVEPERAVPLEVASDVEGPVAVPELAATRAPIAVSDDATDRPEPTFDAPSAHVTPAPVTDREIAREAPTPGRARLNKRAGRKDPTFDAPVVQQIAAPDDAAKEPVAQAAASAVAERADVATDEGLSIAALEEVAGRKEPTFDKPVHRAAVEIERPIHADAETKSRADEPSAAADIAPKDSHGDLISIAALDEAAGRKEPTFDQPVQRPAPEIEPSVPVETKPRAQKSVAPEGDRMAADHLSIAALDEAAGRKEPTFDQPVRPTKPAAVQTAAPSIKLRPIETRIEVRHIDMLRAEPPLSARRPIFPHIEPEEWDMAPVAAVQAHRERRGTGWAIGLGTVLLVAGITAPAAIWQQGRQAQDQVALVNPAPTTPTAQQVQAPPPDATATAQTTLPAAPQPESPPPAPTVAAEEPSAPTAPTQVASTSEAEQANPKPAATLGPVKDGGDVNAAPVNAPPPPMVNLASKTDGTGAMTARPFVPEQGDGPFLRAPTTGTTSVPVASAPGQPAAVGVKPSLMVQLKPNASATVSAAKPVATKPRPATRKPKPFFQQSPDQMFQTLIDTLSEGKPVNPATKPVSPSNRR